MTRDDQSELERLHDIITQRDQELLEWGRRYDDAVQPLQRRVTELSIRLDQMRDVLKSIETIVRIAEHLP